MSEVKHSNPSFVRIAEGDKKAFEVFFDCYYPKLVRFADTFVHDQQAAEDVVADVLTTMLIHRQRVFRLPHVEAYLYASVKNKALSSLRNRKKITRLPPDVQSLKQRAMEPADPYALLVDQELQALVHKMIQSFPPKRRMVFQLLREEGFSYRQVAALMQISERTVEVHLRLAVKTLRQGIENYLSQQETQKTVLNLVKVWAPLLLFWFFN